MPFSLHLTFAEQNTGFVTRPDGERANSDTHPQRFGSLAEALSAAESYLTVHRDHEAWVATAQSRHRVTLPVLGGFHEWIDSYRQYGSLGRIRLSMSFGDVIGLLGFPQRYSTRISPSPLSVIFRYLPGEIDFHFDAAGLLWLIHNDAADAGHTMLKPH